MMPAHRSLPPYDARQVANLLLDIAHSCDVSITNMSINKLVFLSHGHYLAIRSAPLIHNPFEAWDHGPVSPALYEEFKRFGASPISSRATILNLLTNERVQASAEIAESDQKFVSEVFETYGRLDAYVLSDITHQPDGAWRQALAAFEHSANFGKRISNETIHRCFVNIVTH